MKAECKHLVLGVAATNCYFLANKETREMILIDPVEDAARLQRFAARYEYQPVAILLTHGHYDHIGAVEELRRLWSVKVYAGAAERELLASPGMNLSLAMGGRRLSIVADEWLSDEEKIVLAGFPIRVLFTPGHTSGGVSYYLEEEGLLISGDTLFAESCGRTDLPTGSMRDIVRSIKERLFPLPEETLVYPGHGPETTIGHEKRHNFVAGM